MLKYLSDGEEHNLSQTHDDLATQLKLTDEELIDDDKINNIFKELEKEYGEAATALSNLDATLQYLVKDIDTTEDWKHAELMYQVLKRSGELD